MNREERNRFITRCADEAQLSELSTTYRMYKYSKWYKELHKQHTQPAILTYVLPDGMEMDNAATVL